MVNLRKPSVALFASLALLVLTSLGFIRNAAAQEPVIVPRSDCPNATNAKETAKEIIRNAARSARAATWPIDILVFPKLLCVSERYHHAS